MLRIWIVALVFLVGSAQAMDKFDCDDAASKSVEETRDELKSQLATNSHPEKQVADELVKLYTCNVIRQPSLWANMYEDEMSTIFNAVYGNVQYDTPTSAKRFDISSDNIIDLTHKFLNGRLRGHILSYFAEVRRLARDEAVQVAKSTCQKVASEFGPFYSEVEELQALSGTDRLLQTMMADDDVFMKLVVVHLTCQELF